MIILNTLFKFVSLINDYIDQEMNDENQLKQKLFEVRLKYEMDEISEEEYEEIKVHLEQRIQQIRERKRENEEE